LVFFLASTLLADLFAAFLAGAAIRFLTLFFAATVLRDPAALLFFDEESAGRLEAVFFRADERFGELAGRAAVLDLLRDCVRLESDSLMVLILPSKKQVQHPSAFAR
jgi:hypothetical protein